LVVRLEEAGYNRDILLDMLGTMRDEYTGDDGSADATGRRERAVAQSRRLWIGNPLYQWSVWVWTAYGFGENPRVEPESKLARKIFVEFWARNQAILAVDRVQELSYWTLIDGETFLAYHADDSTGDVRISWINPDEMTPISHPINTQTTVAYKRESPENVTEKTLYYPDWETSFSGALDAPVGDGTTKTLAQALSIPDSQRADKKWSKARVHPTREGDFDPPHRTAGELLLEVYDPHLIREQNSLPGTIAVVQHICWNRKTRNLPRGWPLSAVAVAGRSAAPGSSDCLSPASISLRSNRMKAGGSY
jgi:hypothetical protein